MWGIVVIFVFIFTSPVVHSCCVIGCTARGSDSDIGFFRIPSEKEPENDSDGSRVYVVLLQMTEAKVGLLPLAIEFAKLIS